MLVRHFACMVLFAMGGVMLLGGTLVLSQRSSVLVVGLLVSSMCLLVGLGQLVDVVDTADLGAVVHEAGLAILLMDQTIELISLLHPLIQDFLLLLSFELGFERLILLLLLLNVAVGFLIIRLLSKAVDSTDDGAIIDEDLLATFVNKTIMWASLGFSLLVLLLEHSLLGLLILNLLLLGSLGILDGKFLLSSSVLLLLGLWFLVSQSLVSVMLLVALVLGKGLGRVEFALGEDLGADLVRGIGDLASIGNLGSLIGGDDLGGVVNWLSVLVMGHLLGVVGGPVVLLVSLVLLSMLRVLGRFLVMDSGLVMLALEKVVFFDLLLSKSLNSSSMALLSLAQLLVVLLLSGNGLFLCDVITIIVQRLLLGQGMESLWHSVMSGGVVTSLVESVRMSLLTSTSVSHVVGGVSSSSDMSHLLWVTRHGVMSHGVGSTSLMELLTIVWSTEVSGWVSRMSSHVSAVRHSASSHLTVVTWLSHLSVVSCLSHLALVVSHSAHSVQAVLLSWVRSGHSALHEPSLLSLHSLLLGLDVLLSLLFTFIEHVTDLTKMVNLTIASVELVVLISALNDGISLLLLGHLSLLGGILTLISTLIFWSLNCSLSSLLLVTLLLSGLLWLLSRGSGGWRCLGKLLLGLGSCSAINFSQNICNDV